MTNKFDKYITESNLRRLILFNKLHTRPELQHLTIKQLKDLVNRCCIILSNFNVSLEKGNIKMELDDKENMYQSSDLINKILEQTFIEHEPTFEGDKDLKKQLIDRWKQNEKTKSKR